MAEEEKIVKVGYMISFAFLGCGFLATHLVANVIPHAYHILLIDRERIEKVNYDNSVFPKNLIGKRKVSALASYIQVLSSVPVTPIHQNITKSTQLAMIYDNHRFEFVFCTFDNIESRAIVKEFADLTNIPILFIGVSENYIYIDWAEHLVLPDTQEKIEKVKLEMQKIRDVCTRLEFRILGVIAAGFAYYTFIRWLNLGEKNMFQISIKDTINSINLKRKK